MARAATSPELALFRTPGKWSKLYAAIYTPTTIYTARINQTFSTNDKVLEITYDTGSGTLANVLPDMTLLVGSSAGDWDKGICRIRDKDATKFYISETADIDWDNNLYLTIVDDFSLWAKPVLISGGVPFMDGGVEYDDQHVNFDPTPIMGPNRVVKLTGADVSITFDWSDSYVIDGSGIATYSTSAPGSSSSSGMATATPTIHWNTTGWKKVYLTLTAANGASFFAVRYVYIWDPDNPPARAQITNPGTCDADSGGWEYEIAMFADADLDTVRDHAMVILFREDHYGDTQQEIGPVVGCENIEVIGWIAGESITWNPEQGSVSFKAYTGQYWMSRIASWPDGVELVAHQADAWTEIEKLTVDLGVWHFLHWRTTATRVMDVFLTGDTRYTKEVSSLADNLWSQLQEMAFSQIFARPGCNALNQFYLEIHPQLVPAVDRDWPTVMTITKPDWVGEIQLDRATLNEVSILDLSGVNVNESGGVKAFFSLSPGHSLPRYGSPETQDRLLLSTQAKSNQLCGLYWGWRNNEFPEIPITFSANNHLIDCFPRQKCNIVISAGDTPRGISYNGGLIPKSISRIYDPETGYLHTEAIFEAVTFQGLAITGDTPGSDDTSYPPTPSFPPLPPFPDIIPGPVEPSMEGPTAALFHDAVKGFIFTDNFGIDDGTQVKYRTVNAGLTEAQYQNANFCFVCPNGALYVGVSKVKDDGNYLTEPIPYIARAPSIGATFEILYDEASLRPDPFAGEQWGIWAVGYNPLKPEEVAIIMGVNASTKAIWIGEGGEFTEGVNVDVGSQYAFGTITYGLNKWLYNRYESFWVISADGSSIDDSGTVTNMDYLQDGAPAYIGHVRAGTTGITFHGKTGANEIIRGIDNLDSTDIITDSNFVDGNPKTGFACDPSGTQMMGTYGAGARGKSGDAGATWTALSSLIYTGGNWRFAWAGGSGSTARWVAAGSYIYLTRDFGDTWLSRQGDYHLINPLMNIDMVRIVGY